MCKSRITLMDERKGSAIPVVRSTRLELLVGWSSCCVAPEIRAPLYTRGCRPSFLFIHLFEWLRDSVTSSFPGQGLGCEHVGVPNLL